MAVVWKLLMTYPIPGCEALAAELKLLGLRQHLEIIQKPMIGKIPRENLESVCKYFEDLVTSITAGEQPTLTKEVEDVTSGIRFEDHCTQKPVASSTHRETIDHLLSTPVFPDGYPVYDATDHLGEVNRIYSEFMNLLAKSLGDVPFELHYSVGVIEAQILKKEKRAPARLIIDGGFWNMDWVYVNEKSASREWWLFRRPKAQIK